MNHTNKSFTFFRNSANVEYFNKNFITPQTKVEPYKENKLQQFIKYLKDIYSTTKTKIEKKFPKRYFYVTEEIPMSNDKKPQTEKAIITTPQSVYLKKCGKSISSLLVHTESKHKKYKRKKRSVESWILEKGETSTSEEDRILTCMSVEETYATSSDGDMNYLAARMKNVCDTNDVSQKTQKPSKLVFVRNKRVQTVQENPSCQNKSIDNVLKKANAETNTTSFVDKDTHVGLIEKEIFVSPITGHLYNINIPELQTAQITYPIGDIFDFIKETDVKDFQTSSNENNDKEHEKLLTAVFDALLSSKEEPIVTYYYDDSFNVRGKKMSNQISDKSDLKTKHLYVAPQMISSTSYCNIMSYISDAQNTAITQSWEDVEVKEIKRKSPFSSNSDFIPNKNYRKESTSSRSYSSTTKKPVLNKNTKSRSTSSTASRAELLPVILEDVLPANNKNRHTNPFVQPKFSSSIENFRKLSHQNESTRISKESDEIILKLEELAQQQSDSDGKITSHSGSSKQYYRSRKSSIPIPAKSNERSCKKRKLK